MKKFIIGLFLMTVSVYSQNYEIYTGAVISKDKDMHANYMLGLNFTVKIKQDREYLNKMIFGMEHSAYMSTNMSFNSYPKTSEIAETCNCENNELESINGYNHFSKKEVRAVSLNLGVNVCETCLLKQLYLISGVTSSKHIFKVDNETINEYYTMHIDASLKYFIKYKNSFITPMVKFNPETFSFGIGYSR